MRFVILIIMMVASVLFVTQSGLAATDTSTNGGLKFKSKDGQSKYQVGGRMMIDYSAFNEDVTNHLDRVETRRMRAFFKGKFFGTTKFKFQYDIAGQTDAKLKDAYVAYTGFKPLTITLGHQNLQIGLENWTSSKYTTFIERSMYSDAFTSGRRFGATLHYYYGDMWNMSLGGYGGSESEYEAGTSAGLHGVARVTAAPIHSKDENFHIGGSFYLERTGTDNFKRYSARMGSHVATKMVDTGTMPDITQGNTYVAELMYHRGPFTIQGEFTHNHTSRTNSKKDLKFQSWYGEIRWVVTGENRAYYWKTGELGRLKPDTNVGKGWGALEVAFKYDHIGLDHKEIVAGKQDNFILGVNWYLNPNIRFMVNGIWAKAKVEGTKDKPQAYVFRSQIDF